jgi:hypothetical protein
LQLIHVGIYLFLVGFGEAESILCTVKAWRAGQQHVVSRVSIYTMTTRNGQLVQEYLGTIQRI